MADTTIDRFASVQGANRSGGARTVDGEAYSHAYGPLSGKGFDTYFAVDGADVRYGTQSFTGSVHGLPINTVLVLFARNSKDHSKDELFFVGANCEAMGPLAKIGKDHTARKGECEWSAYVETFAGKAVLMPNGTPARKLATHIKDNKHPYGPESKAEIEALTLADAYRMHPALAPKKV